MDAVMNALLNARAEGLKLLELKSQVQASGKNWEDEVHQNSNIKIGMTQIYMRIAREWNVIEAYELANPGSLKSVRDARRVLIEAKKSKPTLADSLTQTRNTSNTKEAVTPGSEASTNDTGVTGKEIEDLKTRIAELEKQNKTLANVLHSFQNEHNKEIARIVKQHEDSLQYRDQDVDVEAVHELEEKIVGLEKQLASLTAKEDLYPYPTDEIINPLWMADEIECSALGVADWCLQQTSAQNFIIPRGDLLALVNQYDEVIENYEKSSINKIDNP